MSFWQEVIWVAAAGTADQNKAVPTKPAADQGMAQLKDTEKPTATAEGRAGPRKLGARGGAEPDSNRYHLVLFIASLLSLLPPCLLASIDFLQASDTGRLHSDKLTGVTDADSMARAAHGVMRSCNLGTLCKVHGAVQEYERQLAEQEAEVAGLKKQLQQHLEAKEQHRKMLSAEQSSAAVTQAVQAAQVSTIGFRI